ncbi:hypothetical protein [Legionella londiniensis]|uniref:Ankyrin repeat-containing protein n=1 Tax=Legionella londiniensis TaxID=45068 RepID=A0A0W0VK37_9GAMM|nr:hypothetical protein [Legionella londiniensis]KTD20317.1 ankyrin repeat-containing protein [Legionella londiniensis]STX93919.1 ankyrin repeat-containing protein [Legionella londiniensis]
MPYTEQGAIIDGINRQYKRDRFPAELKLNDEGVCRGLSTVYAYYALQNKEDDFKKILEIIASGNFENGGLSKEEIYLFAQRVLIAQSPQKYALHLSQPTSMETLHINHKPLRSSFNFALAASDQSWAKIIKEINLQSNEVMLLGSTDHAAAVRRKNNGYIVYDPNYESSFKYFNDEKALIRELHGNVFGYLMFGNLGLSVNVIRHPEAQTRICPFPDATKLYETYAGSKNSSATTVHTFPKLKKFNTLIQSASRVNDANAIAYLLNNTNPSHKEIFSAAVNAVAHNNVGALKPLIPKIKAQDTQRDEMKGLFLQALKDGRLEAFLALEGEFQEYFPGLAAVPLIKCAAQGGNPLLLEKLLQKVSDNLNSHLSHELEKKYNESNGSYKQLLLKLVKEHILSERLRIAIPEAIQSGSTGCVDILLKELKNQNHQLNDRERLDYLLEAVANNKLEIVKHLIENNPVISKELLSTISMTSLAVKRTELQVLMVLKRQGVIFSPEASNIIDQKLKGGWLNVHTVLDLLLNYLYDLFGKKQVTYEERLKEYKKNNCEILLADLENQLKHCTQEKQSEVAAFIKNKREMIHAEKDLTKLDRVAKELQEKLEELIPKISLDEIINDLHDMDLILDELLEGKVDDEHDELNDAETDALPSGQETVMKQEEDSVKALKNQSFFSDLQNTQAPSTQPPKNQHSAKK